MVGSKEALKKDEIGKRLTLTIEDQSEFLTNYLFLPYVKPELMLEHLQDKTKRQKLMNE